MTINSVRFLLFFLIVFFVYYIPLKEKIKAQNILLFAASYVFYGIADWRMLPLLIAVTAVFYWLGLSIDGANKTAPRKAALLTTAGVVLAAALLLYFKYLNFFISSFARLFESFGLHVNITTFNIIMPVGISFFTFRLISYVVDIYRERIKPVRSIVTFAVYPSFFPTMMAGPIDRPGTFIPQLEKKRAFDYALAVDGCRQILFGLFKKAVVADNAGVLVDYTWGAVQTVPAFDLLSKCFLYAVQLYADFSGYSDMSIGVGKLLGFRITVNFKYPYFSKNITEFWRKWHISLTSWLTDYVFMPLNVTFRNFGKCGTVFAVLINFILVGLWHGAKWTYVVFGLYHGLLYIPFVLGGAFGRKNKQRKIKPVFAPVTNFASVLGTFILVSFSLIIFRAESLEAALFVIRRIFSPSVFTLPVHAPVNIWNFAYLCVSIPVLFISEWINRKEEYALSRLPRRAFVRWLIYIIILLLLVEAGEEPRTFVYYQF
jgi:D-alanyl-lipoteichoic acid acyltransferase DltB (MBOAT superfamily)